MTVTERPINWLLSTVGKRGYIVNYLRDVSPNGSRFIGTGCDEFTPGFMACDQSYLVPRIDDPAYLDEVREVLAKEKIGAAITLSDIDVRVFSELRDKMTEEGTACFFPSKPIADRFGNKQLSADFWQSANLRTPRTTSDLNEALNDLRFPLIIKPRDGFRSVGLGVFHDDNGFIDHWKSLPAPMAQEFIEGKLINVEVCSDMNGEALVGCVWEKLQSVDGECSLTRTIEHKDAIELVLKSLKASPVPGPIDVDIIDRDGELFLIEINTRFGGGYPVSHLAGADFPGAMVDSVFGRKPSSFDRYERGVYMIKDIAPIQYFPERVAKSA